MSDRPDEVMVDRVWAWLHLAAEYDDREAPAEAAQVAAEALVMAAPGSAEGTAAAAMAVRALRRAGSPRHAVEVASSALAAAGATPAALRAWLWAEVADALDLLERPDLAAACRQAARRLSAAGPEGARG